MSGDSSSSPAEIALTNNEIHLLDLKRKFETLISSVSELTKVVKESNVSKLLTYIVVRSLIHECFILDLDLSNNNFCNNIIHSVLGTGCY